jgi:hypothetical protein
MKINSNIFTIKIIFNFEATGHTGEEEILCNSCRTKKDIDFRLLVERLNNAHANKDINFI